MTHGVIGAFWVGGILHSLINYEVHALERYVHG